MIYNIVYYAQSQTSYTIKANGTPSGFKGNVIIMNLRGGDTPARINRTEYSLQLVVKNEQQVLGNEIIKDIYDVFDDIYNFILPEVTVNSKVYPAVTVAQCSPNQYPGYIGTDENGLHLFSVNFRFIV